MRLLHTFVIDGRMYQADIKRGEPVDEDRHGNPIEWLWNWDLLELPAAIGKAKKIDEGKSLSRNEAVRHAEGAARLYVHRGEAVSV